MTKGEASQIVALIFAAYDARPSHVTVEIYETMLLDLDFRQTRDAVFEHIKASKWLPKVAEIRERVVPPQRYFAAPYHVPFPQEPERPMLPGKVVAMATRKPLGESEQRKAEREQARQRELAARLLAEDENAQAAKGAG